VLTLDVALESALRAGNPLPPRKLIGAPFLRLSVEV